MQHRASAARLVATREAIAVGRARSSAGVDRLQVRHRVRRGARSDGFETDGANHGFGVPGGYGSFATAEPYKAGPSTGQAAYSYFRGFINDEKLLRKDESRVFSSDIGHIVLKTSSGRVIAFESEGNTPDEPVDYETLIQMIGRSIVVKPPR